MTDATRDWRSELTALGLVYGFFSRVFQDPPSPELVAQLAEEELFEQWPIEAENEELRTGLVLLRRFCEDWRAGRRPDLEADHARLFLGPGLPAAPPWESVHLSAEHVMFERQTMEVREAYARFGLEAPRVHREPDDHISLELAFLVHLCGLGVAAVDSGDTARLEEVLRALRSFLSGHLLAWAPAFLSLVAASARTDFYRGVAHLARGSLAVPV